MIVVKCECGKKRLIKDYEMYLLDRTMFRDYYGVCRCGRKIFKREFNLMDCKPTEYLN
ncbi:MAG: hypothetical protein K0M69_08310 [Youngiibacter sp.]|jgi:hypothetical protein|nr:hypothetical protein [Youngiibacter sp.]